MLDPSSWSAVAWPASLQPLLLVVIDAEAEFDWSKKNSRQAVGVASAASQRLAQRIFDRFGVRPSYMVDYPVSSREEGYRPIREIWEDGRCEIGAHLQPWDTPPFFETLNEYNSYPGNLPPSLERQKLVRLTETIAENIGVRPRLYKAGRYGIGTATSRILAELKYEIDLSVHPGTDLRPFLGPDFTACGLQPYWCGPGSRILEIPLSIGLTGLLSGHGNGLYRTATKMGRFVHLPGILARLRLLDRITLTPEGMTFSELCRLTQALVRRGQRIFYLTYHSPSLAVGNTPYVRTARDLENFVARIAAYLDYFMGEIGGRPSTPLEVKAIAQGLATAPIERPLVAQA